MTLGKASDGMGRLGRPCFLQAKVVFICPIPLCPCSSRFFPFIAPPSLSLSHSRSFTPERSESTQPPHPNDVQIHVLRHWCYLGSVSKPEEASTLDCMEAGFDADGYKILCKPLLSGRSEVIVL